MTPFLSIKFLCRPEEYQHVPSAPFAPHPQISSFCFFPSSLCHRQPDFALHIRVASTKRQSWTINHQSIYSKKIGVKVSSNRPLSSAGPARLRCRLRLRTSRKHKEISSKKIWLHNELDKARDKDQLTTVTTRLNMQEGRSKRRKTLRRKPGAASLCLATRVSKWLMPVTRRRQPPS